MANGQTATRFEPTYGMASIGLTTWRQEKKGWLRSLLIEKDLLKGDKSALWQSVMEDYRC